MNRLIDLLKFMGFNLNKNSDVLEYVIYLLSRYAIRIHVEFLNDEIELHISNRFSNRDYSERFKSDEEGISKCINYFSDSEVFKHKVRKYKINKLLNG